MRHRSQSGQAARAVATDVLVEVLDHGRSLTSCLAERLNGLPDQRDRALVQELCYGVLRWLPRLEAALQHLVSKPLRRRDSDIRILLLLGLYQLTYTRIPPHAAVSETVAVTVTRGKDWARGLVNATLRRYQDLDSELGLDSQDESRYSHPTWLIRSIRQAWPDNWKTTLVQNNERAPMTLRVNALKRGRDAYLAELAAKGMIGYEIPDTTHGISLSEPTDVARLPGFELGLVSVQDAASQLAPGILSLETGQRVLDACAAPGGKTAHILEQGIDLAVLTALEREPARLRMLEATLSRLGLEAQTVCADAGQPERWWDGRCYDRILLDAPCSATGVIRRHPDIKHRLRVTDVSGLVEAQARLLDVLWVLLAPGGLLLYATCSILPQENHLQVQRLMGEHPDAVERAISGVWGRSTHPGRQILPGEKGMDGFYYAILEKR